MCVLGAVHRHGEQLVLAQDFDVAFGPALALGDEQHRVATVAGLRTSATHSCDAAVELHGGLART